MTTVWVGVLLLAQANSPMLNMEPEGLDRAPERIEADQETDPVKYRQKAKALYDRAERLLGNDLGIEAAQTFRMVMEKYPFSRFAVLAELGHAKALAAQGEAEGALSGFTRFLKQHPGHPKSGDVRFAIIQTSWAERPGTFALLPPAHERDLEDARATVIAANAFLEFHRDDARSGEVRQDSERSEDAALPTASLSGALERRTRSTARGAGALADRSAGVRRCTGDGDG